jgi:phosphate transport system substrate-binding protein
VKFATLAMLVLSIVPGLLSAQEEITVGGAGAMVPFMQELATAYQAKHPTDRVEILTESLGSTGGIKAAEAGRIAIGLTARPLNAGEGKKLVYRLIGRTPLIVGLHRDIPVNSLTESQICDIFAGRIRTWKEVGGDQSPIVVLTRNEDGTKEAFRAHMKCFKALREGSDAIIMPTPDAMSEALVRRPATIGLTDLAVLLQVQGGFKALAIEGLAPTIDTMRSGKYKWVKEFGVVTAGAPQGGVKRFLDFAVGPEGERILARHGVVVVR